MERDISTTLYKNAYHHLNMIACEADPADYMVEALSRYIPSYVIEKETQVGKYVCPQCSAAFIEIDPGVTQTNYCGNCGQKLKWK